MFIVKLQGGLGNQLWQYAFGQYLIQARGVKVLYDVSFFKQQSQRQFLLPKVLKNNVPTINTSTFPWRRRIKKFSTFREIKNFTFDKKIHIAEDNTIFDGYFQHYKYIMPIEAQLKSALRPVETPQEYRTLKETHALLALHIRRGDYETDETIGGLYGHCSSAYYTQALEEMRTKVKNPYVLIFSDDIAWTKENLELDLPHEYVQSAESTKSTVADFSLMRFCNHFIIANSSFSWLAAWLGSTKNSRVITPYFFNFRHNAKTRQCSPPRWKPLSHTFVEKKPKTPKVAIIIPVYNVEAYLARCLESVCNQSLEDIEIIVINDCSPDNSEKIVHEYQSRDPRIVYVKHKKNLRQGGARNTGIRKAKADWLLFVDSDDWIHKDMAKTMLEKAREHGVKVVNCGIMGVSEQHATNSRYDTPIEKDTKIENIFHHFCYEKKPWIINAPWNKLWHKSLFIDNKVYFPHHIFGDDAATTPLLLYHTREIISIPESYYFYLTDRTASITNTRLSMKPLSHFPAIQRHIYSHFEKLAIKNSDITSAYEQHLHSLANFHYNQLAKYINSLEDVNLLQEYLKHYSTYGIRAVAEGTNQQIQELSENRWYKFGQLAKKEKVKFLLKFLYNKILRTSKARLKRLLGIK